MFLGVLLCPMAGEKGFCSRATHPALQKTCSCPTFPADLEHHLLTIAHERLPDKVVQSLIWVHLPHRLQPLLVPNTLNPTGNPLASGTLGHAATIPQRGQVLEQMKVTRAHDSKGLQPLKAMAGQQKTPCFRGSSWRPVPLGDALGGMEWDGERLGCKTC